ncbi:hypothetical protein BC834DRAFT_846056 [Gloeopeniophorella convolvens]|nr:hypothetical protein BC834DRAFT_846056 [Gloeopeniophorella convolvens]
MSDKDSDPSVLKVDLELGRGAERLSSVGLITLTPAIREVRIFVHASDNTQNSATKKRGRQATPSDKPKTRKRRRSVGTSKSQHPEGQAQSAKDSQRPEESRGKQAATEGALATSSSIMLEEVVPDSQGEEEVRPRAVFVETRPIPEDVYYDFMGSLDDLIETQMSQLGPTQLERLQEHKCDKTEISSGLGQLRTLEGQ